MIKILPNGRILVRNTATKDSKVLKATEVSDYLQDALEGQIKEQEEQDDMVTATKKQFQDSYQEFYDSTKGKKDVE